jgi:hypothetical protein
LKSPSLVFDFVARHRLIVSALFDLLFISFSVFLERAFDKVFGVYELISLEHFSKK